MQVIDHKIKFGDVQIYYRTIGDSKKQPILFLPGWPGIYLEKSGVFQELAKYFYVISPEHPGLLRSTPLSHYENIFDQYGEVVRVILQKEKLNTKKLIVMGQSFGGGIASHYAFRYPNYVKTLVFIDSVIGAGNVAVYVKFLFNLGPKLIRFAAFLPIFLQKKVAFAVFGIPSTHFKKFSFRDRFEMLDNYAHIVIKAWKDNHSLIEKDYGSFPILFVWGDRDGKEFNLYGSCNVDDARSVADKLRAKGKEIKFITVSGGHTILYEKPEYVVNEIIKNLS